MDAIYAEFQLNRDIPVPLYYQVKTFLEEQITSGRLKVGDMIPPEEELSAYWEVSRSTVRKALSELVAQGLLDRLKAKGTFVTKPAIEGDFIQKLSTFDVEMRSRGYNPSTKLLSISLVEDYPEVAKILGLAEDAKLIELERLRFADALPVVYVRSFLPAEPFPKLFEVDFTEASLYDSMAAHYGLIASKASRRLQAIEANPEVAKLLEVPEKSPVLFSRSLASDQNGVPFEYSLASYRSDIYSLRIDLEIQRDI